MRLAPALLLLSSTLAHSAAVPLSDLSLAGSAHLETPGSQQMVLRLTPAHPDLAGAAWLPNRQQVANGFETEVEFRITDPGGLGGGADGFAFVLQNSGPAALGGKGSGGGFALGEGAADDSTIPQSIAVFFDTFRNEEIGDRSNNFVTVCTAGTPSQLRWPPPRLASSKKLAVNLKDQKPHTVRVEYQPPALAIDLDGKRVLQTVVDLSTVIGSDGAAWIGFTASTGAGYENHDILSWSFTGRAVTSNISFLKTACLPDRNLCTPEQATVEETGPGSYHVVLPGNLESPVSIPNPDARPVAILNARGGVCRDVSTLGTQTCLGSSALIQRNADGRTLFSISSPGDPASNQGYFEFDAQLQ